MRAHPLFAFGFGISFFTACAAPPKCATVATPPAATTPPSAQLPESTASAPHTHAHSGEEHAGEKAHTHGPDLAHAGHATPPTTQPSDAIGIVVPHGTLKHFGNNGNDLVGIATPTLGAREHEVWRSTIAVGSHTPLHRHESEEVFIFLRGKGRAEIGGSAVEFSAPATVIAPAGVPHQFFNTGSEPTDAIVVVGLASTIVDAEGTPMQLPWRR